MPDAASPRPGTKYAGHGIINPTNSWNWIVGRLRENQVLAAKALHYAHAAERDQHSRTYLPILVQSAQLVKETADDLYDRVVAQLQGLQQCDSNRKTGDASLVSGHIETRSPENRGHGTPGPQQSELLAQMAIFNPNGRRELILVVDDDNEIAENAAQLLAEEDFRVITAADAAEALRIFRQVGSSISLIILDFLLPDLDGKTLFKRLKSIDNQVNVLLGSGFLTQGVAGSETLDTMRLAGLRGFVAKPYTRDSLLKQVATCLAARA